MVVGHLGGWNILSSVQSVGRASCRSSRKAIINGNPLPPLDEQRRIVARLDELMAAAERAHRAAEAQAEAADPRRPPPRRLRGGCKIGRMTTLASQSAVDSRIKSVCDILRLQLRPPSSTSPNSPGCFSFASMNARRRKRKRLSPQRSPHHSTHPTAWAAGAKRRELQDGRAGNVLDFVNEELIPSARAPRAHILHAAPARYELKSGFRRRDPPRHGAQLPR